MSSVWFMDVDGVMAPFGKGGAFRDWIRSPHEVYELWLSPTQAALITDVLEETGAELVWVTTWGPEVARYVEDVLGWPRHRYAELPVGEVYGDTVGPSGRWWKLEAVLGFLDELGPDRFVWSDDDHRRHQRSVEKALQGVEGQPLLQGPRPWVGLTRTSIADARAHLSPDGA